MAALVACVWGNTNVWTRLEVVNVGSNPIAAGALAVAAASAPLLLLALLRAWRSPPSAGVLLRWAFGGAVLTWFAYALIQSEYDRAWVGCAVAAWASLVAVVAWRSRSDRRGGRLARLLLGLSLALLGGELLLRGAAVLFPMPLLLRGSAAFARQLLRP
jgi:hypothetical protein